MPTSASTLRFFRQTHLYLGLFTAPALLFFALTGALQTFGLHETTQGSTYKPPAWIVTISQLHKKQTTTVPVRKPRPAADQPPNARPKSDKPVDAPPASPAPPQKSHLPMKIFFLLVSIGLFLSTLTGIYMAYKYGRSKVLVTGLLVAGVVVPLLLLPF